MVFWLGLIIFFLILFMLISASVENGESVFLALIFIVLLGSKTKLKQVFDFDNN